MVPSLTQYKLLKHVHSESQCSNPPEFPLEPVVVHLYEHIP